MSDERERDGRKSAPPCLYPICSCYRDTSSHCDQESCTYPKCACDVADPSDDFAKCERPSS